MPTSVDLVTDLPADFEVFGQAVDTRLKALQPGTTLGDLAYSSATANTNTRLGIGTTGQVLTVAAGVPSWGAGGGTTLLSTTTLSGATTTISGISGSYKNLIAITFGVTNATADGGFQCAPNGSLVISTSTRNSNSTAISQVRDAPVQLCQTTNNPMLRTNADNSSVFEITNYASTTAVKPFTVTSGYVNTAGDAYAFAANGYIKTTSAITSLVFNNTGGNLSTGTVLLYGVN
jgi:hypothetical protein